MLNFLIVNAPNNPLTESSVLIEPVDALTLATWIQYSHNNVKFIDLDRHGIDIINHIQAEVYDIAIVVFDYYIPLHTTASLELFDTVFSLLSPVTEITLLAGKFATYQPDQMLSKFPLLDGCILGEAEWVINQLCTLTDYRLLSALPNIYTRKTLKKRIVPLRLSNHQNIYQDGIPVSGPIADRMLCNIEDYIDVRSIISSRGCKGRCRFCSTAGYWGAWRGASPELILAEMHHLYKLGTHKIIFLDDNFTNDPYRVMAICEQLRRHPIDCVWGCLSRIEDVSLELLRQMALAGCRWIHFGIEHGTAEIRTKAGKRFTNEQAMQVISYAKSLGLRIRTSWILDLPGATPRSVEETFKFAQILGSHEIKLHFLAVRPGSTLYKASRKDNYLLNNDVQSLANEIHIHKGTANLLHHNNESITVQLEHFRVLMSNCDYQCVDNIEFWRKFDQQEAKPDERFLSTVVTRYGLGWY